MSKRSPTDEPRIVSLVPSLTELLFAMDLGQYVVGRTGFCIHPADQVGQIPKVGGTKSIDIGRVRALAPTHLVVNREENPKAIVDQLYDFVPNVVVTHPISVGDNIRLYRQFGDIFDRSVQAEELADQFEMARTRLLSRQFTPLRVLYLIWRSPWMTVASDTFISHMLLQANMITVPDTTGQVHKADAQRYPALEPGDFAVAGADVVLMSSEPYRFRQTHETQIRGLPGMSETPCLLINGEMTSWYGSRVIEGLNYLGGFRAQLEQALGGETP